ncbi:hypothetical protein [Burkholderia sp. 3C]
MLAGDAGMRRTTGLNFVAPRARITPSAAIALCCALMVMAIVGREWTRVDTVRDAVDRLSQRIDVRQRSLEREQRLAKARTPEQRRIASLLAAQQSNQTNSGLPVIDWIEHAWTPHIALKSLTVDKAGRQARIEGGAADLAQIYMFVDRLNDRHPDRRTGLLQHRAATENGKPVFYFSLSLEHP